MEWFKALLYGKKITYNSVYYQSTPPNPKKGWLRKSALITGDIWFNLASSESANVWSDGRWKKLGVD